MSLARRVISGARRLGVDYRCFRVMRLALDAPPPGRSALPTGIAFRAVTAGEVGVCEDATIRACAFYGGKGAHGFALLRGARTVCLQWIWHGERAQALGFWPLGPRDAVSIHLVTVPDERGHGHATLIKRLTAARMRDLGFAAIYSRIWWTNAASLRVSEKAGWRYVGATFSVDLPGRSRPLEWRRARLAPASATMTAEDRGSGR